MSQLFLGQPLPKTVSPEDMPFYKILQALERGARLTEKEVIRRLDIPRSTYRSWKDGTSEPSRRVYWRKLAWVFGVTPDDLITGATIQKGSSLERGNSSF